MRIEENYNLQRLNTFGISASARFFAEINSEDDLLTALEESKWKDSEKLPLGGGSNVLFTKDFDGLVLKMGLPGIELIEETESDYIVRVGAGENWHQFVLHCIGQGWAGVENLSLIPGNVGAAPMQNIGAYGVEIEQVLEKVRAYLPEEKSFVEFTPADCELGYRSSIFKTKLKNRAYITEVTFRLKKSPKLNTSYGAIEQELNARGISSPNIKDVSDAVIAIRSSKLPDPKKIGNAGSFFKNPVVDQEVAKKVFKKFPNAPHYPAGEGQIKIPAGWLIETAGWKGKTYDNSFGIHNKQALVLVNLQGATGRQIFDLSQNILEDISDKFGITLEREVNII